MSDRATTKAFTGSPAVKYSQNEASFFAARSLFVLVHDTQRLIDTENPCRRWNDLLDLSSAQCSGSSSLDWYSEKKSFIVSLLALFSRSASDIFRAPRIGRRTLGERSFNASDL